MRARMQPVVMLCSAIERARDVQLSKPVVAFVREHLQSNGFRLLPLDLPHLETVQGLPLHHRDPDVFLRRGPQGSLEG